METGMTMKYDKRHEGLLVEKINFQVNIFRKSKKMEKSERPG
jgi:hypothetical protein